MLLSTPLWKQLVVVWAAALALALVLLAVDGWFTRPVKFFWLLPHRPGLRDLPVLLWPVWRARPLTFSALLLVPALAVLITVGLAVARPALALMRGGRVA